jgi:hypothetical protein
MEPDPTHQSRLPRTGSEPPTPDPTTATLLPPPNTEHTSSPRHPILAWPTVTRGVDEGPAVAFLTDSSSCAGGQLRRQWQLGFDRRLSRPTERRGAFSSLLLDGRLD